MSRSRKKVPMVGTACHRRGSMAKWKNQNNRRIRRIDVGDDLPSYGYVRRVMDIWDSPNDGKHYWDDPKGYRK